MSGPSLGWFSASAKIPATGVSPCPSAPPCCNNPYSPYYGTMTLKQIVSLKLQMGFAAFEAGSTYNPLVVFATFTSGSKSYDDGIETTTFGGSTTFPQYGFPTGYMLSVVHDGPPYTVSYAGAEIINGYTSFTVTSQTTATTTDSPYNGIVFTLSSPVDPGYSAVSARALGASFSSVSDGNTTILGFNEFGWWPLLTYGTQLPSQTWIPWSTINGQYMVMDGSGNVISTSPFYTAPSGGIFSDPPSNAGVTLQNNASTTYAFTVHASPVLPTTYITSGWSRQISGYGENPNGGSAEANDCLAYLRLQWKTDTAAAYWYGEYTVNADGSLNKTLHVIAGGTAAVGTYYEMPAPSMASPTSLWPLISDVVVLFIGVTKAQFLTENPGWTLS